MALSHRAIDIGSHPILHALPEPAVVLAANGTIEATNPPWAASTPERGAPGSAVGSNYLEACRAEIRAGIEAVIRGDQDTFVLDEACDSPTRLAVFRVDVRPLEDSQPRRVLVRYLDETDQRHATTRLRIQSQVLERIARGAPLHATLELLCLSVEAVRDRSVCTVMELNRVGTLDMTVAPSMPEATRQVFQNLKPSSAGGSCAAAACDREAVYVSDTSEDPRWLEVRQVGDELGLKSCWSLPIFEASGALWGTIAVSHLTARTPDVNDKAMLETAMRLAVIAIERDRHFAEIRAAQRAEVIARLAQGTAHDTNNLITLVSATLQCITDDLDSEDSLEMVQSARDALVQSAALTRSLLELGKAERTTPELIDPSRVIREVAALCSRTFPAWIKIEIDCPGPSPQVLADTEGLRHALLNLALNARDAMPEAGFLTLRLRADGGDVAITVEDSGTGMTPDVLEHALEPLYSTKDPEEGSGLGLPMVNSFATESGGTLEIDSAPGQGSRITVRLPRAPEGAKKGE